MQLKDLKFEKAFYLWIEPTISDTTFSEGIGTIHIDENTLDYKLKINNELIAFNLQKPQKQNDLNHYLSRGVAHLAEITDIAHDGNAKIKIVFFNGNIIEMGNIEIGVDDRIEQTCRKNGFNFTKNEELCKLLHDKMTISVDNDEYFIMYAGKSANEDFDSEENDEIEIEEKFRCFSMCGTRIHLPVEKKQIAPFEEIFQAVKVVCKDIQNINGSIRLVHSSVKFTSLPEKIQTLASGAMEKILSQNDSYLKKWDEYGAKEGDLLLSRAKAVGELKVKSTSISGDNGENKIKIFLDEIPEDLSDNDTIELTTELPSYIENPDISWTDYSIELEANFSKKKLFNKLQKSDEVPSKYASVKILKIVNNATEKSILLDLDTIPDKKFHYVLSIQGDKVQIERRMKARDAIMKGRSANPSLGLLIEEGCEIPSTRRTTKIKPLSPFVKDKIFKNEPTKTQIKAIEMALNTPDIALIQGPPGTGKTTVVTAIIERLNEEFDKENSIRGQILVSGFQHDAVENIVSRLSVNALPTIKFGKRSGSLDSSEDAVIENWCDVITAMVRANNPSINKTEEQIKLLDLFTTYSTSPSETNTLSLFNAILELPRSIITEDIINEVSREKENYEYVVNTNKKLIKAIRSLRIQEQSFKDDGTARACDLLLELESIGYTKDISVLKTAAKWNNSKPLDFFNELLNFKRNLLSNFLPKPEYKIIKPQENIIQLFNKVSNLLDIALNEENKKERILAEFVHELEGNPYGVRDAISDYNFVFAATTQQAVGNEIIKTKNKFVKFGEQLEMVKYDTVIIDEAARTSPRDLLIPMAMAEKRIILVGDHRQLPHIIDEEVARSLENSTTVEGSKESDYLKNSMFQYLFKRLKKLELSDNIERTITLDAQYRTHPLLGKFASDNFYKDHNEEYESPLSENYFSHSLTGIENKAAVWIDVPNEKGVEKRSHTKSRYRESEASAIAEKMNKWIKTEEGKNLTFGVISFYKAQIDEVYKALEEYNICKKGQRNIVDEYRLFENGEERIRIGTVDSFQGMEFDVVFLSMVRSQNMDNLPLYIKKENNKEKQQQKLFGHLMSVNRLCVSMSRQKKVLVLVGDKEFGTTEIAKEAIPAINNFHTLCSTKGVVLS